MSSMSTTVLMKTEGLLSMVGSFTHYKTNTVFFDMYCTRKSIEPVPSFNLIISGDISRSTCCVYVIPAALLVVTDAPSTLASGAIFDDATPFPRGRLADGHSSRSFS